MISPFAKPNFVDSTLTDTTSILRFIEDNWNLGRVGDQSFDAQAGSIQNMFSFYSKPAPQLFLDPETGAAIDPNQLTLRERPHQNITGAR